MRRLKSLLALVLAIIAVLSLAACGFNQKETPDSGNQTSGNDGTSGNDSTSGNGSTSGKDDSSTPGGDDAGDLTGIYDPKDYTYRLAPSELPTSWNAQSAPSDAASYVLDYTSDSLYSFDYNDDYTGYQIVPAMAKEFPIDVTADYVGRYGIAAGDKNKAYKIVLKDYLTYDNGDALDAHAFVESMKCLLDPVAKNLHAADVYASGTLKIYNAEAYCKQSSYALGEFASANDGAEDYVDPAVFTVTNGGTLQYNGRDIVLDLSDGGNWGHSLDLYDEEKRLTGVQTAYDALDASADGNRQVKLTPTLLKHLQNCIAYLRGYASVEAYAAAKGEQAWREFEKMVFLGKFWDALEYDGNVGFFALSDTELVIVLTDPMEDNFYLRRRLMTDFHLVHVPTYKLCEKIVDGVYTNTYGTDVNSFVGFGPYELVQYIPDVIITLERHDGWRGYTKADYISGTYQTDEIRYRKVTEDSVRLEMFLEGEIDSYSLTPEDMDDYLGSDYTYFNVSESIWYLAMNPDAETLAEMAGEASPVHAGNAVIKTPIAITEFRQALSYSLNRTAFNQLTSPTSDVAKALLSSAIIADPESGMTYRSTDAAKDVILGFWGLSDQWGEGKKYATRDEAIASITGYDLEGAKRLFDIAYEKAVQAGYITDAMIASGKWEVQICIGKIEDTDYYSKGYAFLKDCWINAVKGTAFEGHVTFVQSQTLGSDSGAYLINGLVDVLFGVGFGGDMFNPYSLMDCFTGTRQYDPLTDKTAINVDIEIDGRLLRASLYHWVSKALQGSTIECDVVGKDGKTTGETVKISAGPSDPAQRRIDILAATEEAILKLSNIFPIQTDATASLKCMRVNYKTEEYILGVGRGGIKYYTYSMDDAEFAAHVAAEGGTLNYR